MDTKQPKQTSRRARKKSDPAKQGATIMRKQFIRAKNHSLLLEHPLTADISLLMVAFVWGATFVLVQNAISVLEPFTFNGVRFFIAALFLLGWLSVFKRSQLLQVNKKMIGSGVILGIWLFGGYALQTLGLLYTTSSKAGFITGLSVVLVPLFTFLLLRQKIKAFAITGALLAAMGLYFLTLGDRLSFNKGDMLVLFCAFSFALHIVFTGKLAKNYSPLPLTLIQILTVAIFSSIFGFIFEDWGRVFNLSVMGHPYVLLAIVVTSVFATALAYFIQTNFQKYTSPTRVALIFAMEPVFAAVAAFIWNDESLGAKALLGCSLILGGMILAELPPLTAYKRQKKAPGV
jgi:drug/metabolite transporter (DMT)-like permease